MEEATQLQIVLAFRFQEISDELNVCTRVIHVLFFKITDVCDAAEYTHSIRQKLREIFKQAKFVIVLSLPLMSITLEVSKTLAI